MFVKIKKGYIPAKEIYSLNSDNKMGGVSIISGTHNLD